MRKPDFLLYEKGATCFTLPEAVWLLWEQDIANPLRLISSLSQQVLGLSRFGDWSINHVACGDPLCWRLFQALFGLFPCAYPLKTALQLGNCLSCLGGPSRGKSKDHWVGSKAVFLCQVTYPCSSSDAIDTWFINCSCFPYRPRRLEWDQAVAEGPSS